MHTIVSASRVSVVPARLSSILVAYPGLASGATLCRRFAAGAWSGRRHRAPSAESRFLVAALLGMTSSINGALFGTAEAVPFPILSSDKEALMVRRLLR
jgi:hypothetical protein